MPVQAFKPHGDVEQPCDDLFVSGSLLQPGLAVDCLAQRYRIGRIGRHQLGDTVDLAIGHLQHAADIAQHGAGLQRSEGDDLGDLVAAVLLLHIADHLFAPLLAEVDVEIGHRHAFGVQKALEQQREAHRVDVGNQQRPGNQRSGTRSPARPDRNVLRLGPADKVGNDQEVARKAHLLDDRQFMREPLVIVFAAEARRGFENLEPLLEPFLGLTAKQLCFRLHLGVCLVAPVLGIRLGETRQDRLTLRRAIGTAQRDLDSVFQRLGQIGEQRRHFIAALEIMFGRQPHAVTGCHHHAFGNAAQRIVCLEILPNGEKRLVGGNQRQFGFVGEFEKVRFAAFLARIIAAAMALQFDIKPVAENSGKMLQKRPGGSRFAPLQQTVDRPFAGTRQADDALCMAKQGFQRDMGACKRMVLGSAGQRGYACCRIAVLRRRGIIAWKLRDVAKKGAARKPDKIAVARLVHCQQNERRHRLRQIAPRPLGLRVQRAEIDRELDPHDRLQSLAGCGFGKFQRAEKIVAVGHRKRRLAVGNGKLDQLLQRQCALEQRIGGMGMQVNEFRRRSRGFSAFGGALNLAPGAHGPAGMPRISTLRARTGCFSSQLIVNFLPSGHPNLLPFREQLWPRSGARARCPTYHGELSAPP